MQDYSYRDSAPLYVCIPLTSLCDGRVDVPGPVGLCVDYSHKYMPWNSQSRAYAFADELFCPQLNGAPGAASGMVVAFYFALALNLLVVLVVGFGCFKPEGEREEDEDGDKEMGVWTKFQGRMFTKLEEQNREDADPIIRSSVHPEDVA